MSYKCLIINEHGQKLRSLRFVFLNFFFLVQFILAIKMSENITTYMEDCGVYAQHVEKYYGSFRVLKDINLNVERGTIYGLIIMIADINYF